MASISVCFCRSICSGVANAVPSPSESRFAGSRNFIRLSCRGSQSHARQYKSGLQLESGPTWANVRCSYSTESGPASSAAPIDVEADVKTQKILVLGGNGFVGSRVSRIATERGFEVVSLNRSGRPPYVEPWMDQVTWVSGDVFNANWDDLLAGVTGVISCIGGFGNNEEMERVNGDANILAVEAASKAGVSKFVYISVHDYNLPEFALNVGYFKGKRRTEAEIISKFPRTGVVLRPGFIYGKRRVNGIDIPLDAVGEPLEKFLGSAEKFLKPFSNLPGSDLLLAPPTSVEEVAKAAVKSLLDDSIFGLIDISQIKEAARSV